MKISLIYITVPDEQEAERVSKILIERKLAACTNVFPIKSFYYWEAKFANEKEFVVLAKTMPQKYGEIKEEMKKVHPYKVPCILKIQAEANQEYGKWLADQLKI